MIDLSTSQGLQKYIDLYCTRRGRWLANRFNLSGKGAEQLAGRVSCYAWNARALEVCITDQGRAIYHDLCRMALEDILAHPLYPAIERRFKFPALKVHPLIRRT